MRNIFKLTTLLIFVFLFSCKQEDKKYTYYKNGKLKEEITLKDGLANGTCKLYYDTGELYKITNYLNGKRHGYFFIFRKSGVLEGIYSYANGKYSGIGYTFYANGLLESVFSRKEDKDNGFYQSFSYSGIKKFESYSINDSTYYYKQFDTLSGQVVDEYHYLNIKPDKLIISESDIAEFSYFLYGQQNTSSNVDFFLIDENMDTLEKKRINIRFNDTTIVKFGPLKKSTSYIVSSVAHLNTRIFKDTISVSVILFK